MQWFTLRALIGVTALTYGESSGEYGEDFRQASGLHYGGELALFTLRWPHLYWEILRIGGGIYRYSPNVKPPTDFMFDSPRDPVGFRGEVIWGTALGARLLLDDEGRNELRLGIHFTVMGDLWPGYSGVQLLYQHTSRHGVAVQVGLMQTSVPFGALFAVGFGI